jgi:hypothetical protein
LIRVGIIALAFFLSACGRPGYPESTHHNFMSSCENNGSSEARCGCIWKRIEAEVPVAEFDAAEQALSAGQDHPLRARILGFAAQCQAPR